MSERKAGRELDIEIENKVMGRPWEGGNPLKHPENLWAWPAPYSTDIAAAWSVHKTACAWIFSIRQSYYAALARIVRERLKVSVAWPDLIAFIEPEDFCLAALAAVESK